MLAHRLRRTQKSYTCQDTVLAKHLMDECRSIGTAAIDIGRTDGVNLYPFAALPSLTRKDLLRSPSTMTMSKSIALPVMLVNPRLDRAG